MNTSPLRQQNNARLLHCSERKDVTCEPFRRPHKVRLDPPGTGTYIKRAMPATFIFIAGRVGWLVETFIIHSKWPDSPISDDHEICTSRWCNTFRSPNQRVSVRSAPDVLLGSLLLGLEPVSSEDVPEAQDGLEEWPWLSS